LRLIVLVVRGFGESAWAYRAIQTPPVAIMVCYYGLVIALAFFFRRPLLKPGAASYEPSRQ
jgi:hypothetical protein